MDRHAGLLTQALGQALQQGAATGQHDAAVHDVAGELGWLEEVMVLLPPSGADQPPLVNEREP